MMRRLAVVASHPIQYQAPWFRAIAAVTDLTVFFCHRQDASGQADAGFGVPFEWDVPLLDGYRFEWLTNVARHPNVSSFDGCDTPDIGNRLGAGRFDACIVSGWYLKSYLQAIWACRQAGIPVMLRGDSQLSTPRSRVFAIAKYLPYRTLLRSVSAHLYVGERNREYLKHYGVDDRRLYRVPHFVDNALFGSRANAARRNGRAAAIRHDGALVDASLVLVFAGKLIAKKRPADLIRAAAIARAGGVDVSLLVVGSGPLESAVRALANTERVPTHFAGFRNQSEIPDYFAAADAVVLPSDGGETWGLVVNEAMACGLPAIVSDQVGCGPDLITPGQTGEIFPMGDVDALAKAIGRLQVTLKQHRAQVRSSIETRLVSYSVEAAVAGTLRALEAIDATPGMRPDYLEQAAHGPR
jgi:glycosyltransferase involved in cell wall biosynthesis